MGHAHAPKIVILRSPATKDLRLLFVSFARTAPEKTRHFRMVHNLSERAEEPIMT